MPTAPAPDRFVNRFRALADPSRKRQPLASTPAVGGDEKTAVIRLYEPIDSWGEWWGVSAKEFADVLDALPDSVEEIRLLINSPGGEVWDGLAILNLLRSHKAKAIAVVEGIAASAASFVAVGCDELVMAPNAELFVHCAWGLCVGNALDMQKMAEELGHEDRNIASIYATKAGGTVEDWLAAMAAETFYSAEEAVEAGLADRVDERAKPADDSTSNRWDRSIFNFAGRRAAPKASAIPPSPRPEGQKGGSVSDLTAFREALGLTEDITDDAIVAALETLPEPTEEETVPAVTPPALPDGVVAVDSATLEQLKADAAAGRKAHDDQVAARRAGVLDRAIADGKFAPPMREHYAALIEKDEEGTTKLIEAMAKNVVPVAQLGHGGASDLDSDDTFYASVFSKEGATA